MSSSINSNFLGVLGSCGSFSFLIRGFLSLVSVGSFHIDRKTKNPLVILYLFAKLPNGKPVLLQVTNECFLTPENNNNIYTG